MSECVVRMPNPDDCNKCAVRFICSPYEDYWQQDTRRKPTPGQKGCRILSVLPENHGRLVDADAAVNDIRDEILEYKMDGLKGTPIPTDHLWLMKNWIADEDICPTIVPAEAERSET